MFLERALPLDHVGEVEAAARPVRRGRDPGHGEVLRVADDDGARGEAAERLQLAHDARAPGGVERRRVVGPAVAVRVDRDRVAEDVRALPGLGREDVVEEDAVEHGAASAQGAERRVRLQVGDGGIGQVEPPRVRPDLDALAVHVAQPGAVRHAAARLHGADGRQEARGRLAAAQHADRRGGHAVRAEPERDARAVPRREGRERLPPEVADPRVPGSPCDERGPRCGGGRSDVDERHRPPKVPRALQ